MKKIDWVAYIYILPVFVFLGVFVFWGMAYNVYVSFFEWDGISDEKLYVGLDNYVQLMKDAEFHQSLGHTLIFMLIYVSAAIFVGFFLAYLISLGLKGHAFFKSIVFIPHVMPVAVVAMLFGGFYDMNTGLLNQILRGIGLEQWAMPWIAEPGLALYSIAGAFIFSQLGFSFIIYYTGLLSINEEVLEAANLDGAGFWRMCTGIVFPMVRGITISLMIMGVIASLKVFDMVWVMTEGGPGGASELASTYVFRQSLLNFQQGYGSTVSVVLLVAALIITAIQLNIYVKGGRTHA